jgi:hypothetical protein
MPTPYEESVGYSPAFSKVGFSPSTVPREVIPEDKQIQQLAQFSATLGKGLFEYQTKRNEQQMMEGYNLALSEDNAPEVSQEIRAAEEQLKADDKIAQTVAYDINRSGESGEVAVSVQNMSGWKRYGYAKGLAEKAGQGYLPWLQTQLATNLDRTFINPATGQEFTLADTSRDPALRGFALAEMRKDYLMQNQLTTMKPAFLNEFAGKEFRNAHSKLIDESRKQFVTDEGQKLFITAQSQFAASGDMNMFFSQMRNARKGNGKLYSRTESWTALSNILVEKAQSGEDVNLEELKKQPIDDDPKGRTYGQLYASQFTALSNDLDQARRKLYNNSRSDDIQVAREAYDRFIKEVSQNPELADPRAIYQAKQRLIASDISGSVVESIWGNAEENFAAYSPERAKHLQEVAQLDPLATEGKLMPWHLEGKTDETKRKYARAARANMQSDSELKTVREAVGKIAESGVKPIRDGEFDFATNIMKADLLREWEVLTKQYMDTQKLDQYSAGRLAAKELSDRVARGRNDPNSDYYQNPTQGGRFTNYVRRRTGGTENQVRNFNEKFNTRLRILEREGGKAFEQAELFFDKTDIEKIQELAKNDPFLYSLSTSDPLYSKVALARSVAQRAGTTLPRIIQRQANALGMGVVDTHSIYEQQTKYLPPKIKGLVNRLVSSTASQQDLDTFYAYQATPGVRGLGQMVRSGEGGYTSMFPSESYPEMTNMTISQLVAFQKQKLRDGRKSAAVGAYQFLYPEVAAQRAGLSMNDKFTPENQEKMFMATLMTKPGRETIAKYLRGQSNDVETAIDELAMEFASIEYRDGRSYYYKDGVNRASVSRARARQALMSARKEMMQGG